AFLAMRAVAAGGRAAPFIGLPLAAASVLVALPGVVAYGREPHPAFRAAEDIARRAEVSPPAMLTSHFGLRGAIRASGLTGLSLARATGPDHAPSVGYVKRSDRPLHLMIGGRHLGEAGDPAADFEMALDGMVIDRWTLTFDQRNFLRFLDLPHGVPAGDGGYARLMVSGRPAAGARRRA